MLAMMQLHGRHAPPHEMPGPLFGPLRPVRRPGKAAPANGHKKTRQKAGFFESEEAKST
jgi:hypothetical protein